MLKILKNNESNIIKILSPLLLSLTNLLLQFFCRLVLNQTIHQNFQSDGMRLLTLDP